MTIDQQIAAEQCLGFLDQPAQDLMIRMIKAFDAPARLCKAELAGIDLLAIGDDPGDGAQTHAHPRRPGVDEFRQRVGKHRRIELIGLAVDVEIGARKPRRQQWGAETRAEPNNSSTKLSSDRRSASGSSREAATNSVG